MEATTRNRPSFANIHVKLEPGDKIIAEADAMASMSASVEMKTRWSGGIMAAILKRIFGGESLFVQRVRPQWSVFGSFGIYKFQKEQRFLGLSMAKFSHLASLAA